MKFAFFILSCYFFQLEALKCNIEQKNGDKIKEALSSCVKNNETLQKIWEMGSTGSEEDQQVEPLNTTPKSNKSRNRRAATKTPTESSKNNEKQSEEQEEEEEEMANTSDNCIIHCILTQLGLVDDNHLPDHSKLADGLLKDVSDKELHNFLQDTVDECYQDVNKEKNVDVCTFSNKLIKCLSDKGKANCADWPAGALPF